MPYRISGNSVVKSIGGKVVGHSSDPKKYLRTLQAVEHGWRSKGKHKIGEAHVNAMIKKGSNHFGHA